MRDAIENITLLQKRMNDLQLENQVLKEILNRSGISYADELRKYQYPDGTEVREENQGGRIMHPACITDEMANKFYGRFWGRQDVYSKRTVKKSTGEVGYFPQCNHFWKECCPRKHGKKIRCTDCPDRDWAKLKIEQIKSHLEGPDPYGNDVIGVYPLLPNGTCRFLVFDFDNHEKEAEKTDFANKGETWMEEVEAMRLICELNGIDPLVERSRSGRGAHLSLTLSDGIYVDTMNMQPAVQNQIRRMAAVSNPVFYRNKAMGLSNYDNARWIYMGKEHLSGYIEIPRGLYDELTRQCRESEITYEIADERQPGRRIKAEFTGQLRPEQKPALKEITFGVSETGKCRWAKGENEYGKKN